MKVETVHVQTRQPRNDEDPGECAIIHYTIDDKHVLRVTDKDGHMLRYPDGEPCRHVLRPDENPRQIAARLARGHRREYGGRGFWATLGMERTCRYEH